MTARPAQRQDRGGGTTLTRIGAMVLRHVYLMRTSWPRIFELMYWPTIQVILWGFITAFLVGHSSYIAQATGVLTPINDGDEVTLCRVPVIFKLAQ